MNAPTTLLAQLEQREQILARLRPVVLRLLHYQREADELDPDAPLFGSGFGLDSLDAVEIVVCLETEFDIRSTDQAIMRGSMRTLNKLVDLVVATRGAAE